ncbi:hypothetical protein RIF29_24164 [Crotalaria pallida]|uniref:Uncharacterized protein n=1 Tax=Crotalaria pallida TaxID=3830 RepID=A0AAN9EJU7_CROPI
MGLLLFNKRESHNNNNANVLKLVHPGGFVELHTKPLMASEVMMRNPRHCVTRPDIFRFPWIVVSPDAILRPGKVFFIVPCHTIRHLMKKFTSTTTNHSLKHLLQRDRFESSFLGQDKIHKAMQPGTVMPCMKLRRGGNKGKGIAREKHVYYSSDEYYYASNNDDSGRERDLISIGGLSHSEQAVPIKLKSCLKKDNKRQSYNARSSDLKVTFACNDEEENNKT